MAGEPRMGHPQLTDEARITAYNDRSRALMQSHAASSWDGDVPSVEALNDASKKCDALLLELLAEVRADEQGRAWINGFATALESVLELSHDKQAIRHACRAAGIRPIDFARANVNPPTLAKLETILSPDVGAENGGNGNG